MYGFGAEGRSYDLFLNDSGRSRELSGFDMSNVKYTLAMFKNCSSLTEILIGKKWKLADGVSSDNMFAGCAKLAGGNGTEFNSSISDKTYAVADKDGQPGYLTLAEPDPYIIRSVSEMYTGDPADSANVYEKWIDNGDNTWTYRFRIFDEDNIYYGWEESAPGYTWETNQFHPVKIRYVAGSTDTGFTVVNTKITDSGTGTLVVTKTVDGDVNEFDLDREFTFTVSVPGLPDGTYGDMTFVDGAATVKLRNGGSATADAIPENLTYTVTETGEPGFSTTSTGETGTIEEGVLSRADFTNTKSATPKGSLSISKTLQSGSSAESFSFKITLTGEKISGTQFFGDYVFKDGVLTVSVGAGQTVTIPGIPAGTEYTVAELDASGFELVSSSGTTGTITENETASVSFTNREIIIPTNSFTLKQIIVGEDTDTALRFSVVLEGLKPNASYILSDGTEYTANSAGAAVVTVDLKSGESVVFEELPIGSFYTVTEAASEYTASYEVTAEEALASILSASGANYTSNTALTTAREELDEDETVTVLFINKPVVYSISFAKTDEKGNFIEGASMEIVGENGGTVFGWISSAEKMETFELAPGSYTLTEVYAPLGYGIASPIAFTVLSDGTLVIGDEESDAAFLVMKDTPSPAIVPDTVVVDFGIPIRINAAANDPYTNTVHAISAETAGTAINGGFSEEAFFTETTVTFDNGTFTVLDDGSILFTPKTMTFTEPIVIYYDTEVTYGSGQTGYLYSSLTVIPATVIYYEDDFVEYTGSWTDDGTLPQNPVYAHGDGVYGYDSAYANSTSYSLGSAKKVTVTADPDEAVPTAEFTFTGTGFDIVSMISKATGTILVDVYQGDNDTPYKMWVVDTYYGCSLREVYYERTWRYGSDNIWHYIDGVEITAAAYQSGVKELPASPAEGTEVTICEVSYEWSEAESDTELYQIPVIKSGELDYDTYRVVISVLYDSFFDHTKAGSYDFYLDAIRVYEPASGNEDAEAAYMKDNEAYPTFTKFRTLLTEQFSADKETTGAVYVDGFGILGDDTDGVAKYQNFGPNNEVYLAGNQAIAFRLNGTNSIDHIHIGAKSLNGTTEMTVNGHNIEIKPATDLYYDVTEYVGNDGLVIIGNAKDGLLSLTNLKLTHTAAPTPVQLAPLGPDAAHLAYSTVRNAYAISHTEAFAPKLNVILNKTQVRVGDKVNVTVTAPADVTAITVNGIAAKQQKANKKTGFVTWTATVTADGGKEKFDVKVVAGNDLGSRSEAEVSEIGISAKGSAKAGSRAVAATPAAVLETVFG